MSRRIHTASLSRSAKSLYNQTIDNKSIFQWYVVCLKRKPHTFKEFSKELNETGVYAVGIEYLLYVLYGLLILPLSGLELLLVALVSYLPLHYIYRGERTHSNMLRLDIAKRELYLLNQSDEIIETVVIQSHDCLCFYNHQITLSHNYGEKNIVLLKCINMLGEDSPMNLSAHQQIHAWLQHISQKINIKLINQTVTNQYVVN